MKKAAANGDGSGLTSHGHPFEAEVLAGALDRLGVPVVALPVIRHAYHRYCLDGAGAPSCESWSVSLADASLTSS